MIDETVFKDKKAVYYTLGCKLNFSETATIERTLQEAGIRTARRGEKADICIVNSCAVTQEAEKKCRQAIHKLVRQHPGAFVVITGCYAQLSPEKLSTEPGVDVVLGIDRKGSILEHLGNLEKRTGGGEWFAQPSKDVRNFVLGHPVTEEFLKKCMDMLTFLLPNYIAEGKHRLVIAIGCTGGAHRSVAIAEYITRSLAELGYRTTVNHRDIALEQAHWETRSEYQKGEP